MGSLRPRTFSAAAGVALVAGLASANPVPWVNIAGPINSKGLYATGDNSILFTPAIPAGGPFTYMTISGTLTSVTSGTFAEEACIEVTMPNGQNFVIQPFTTGSWSGSIPTPAGSVTIPLTTNFGGGVAILRFFENYRDSAAGVDSSWSNLQITLHNAAGGDVVPLNATIAPSAIDPDVSPVQVVTATQGGTPGGSLTFPTNRVVNSVRIRGYGTSIGGTTSSSSTPMLNWVTLNFTATSVATGAPVTWSGAMFPATAPSSGQTDVEIAAPVPVLSGPSNPWTYTVTGNPAVAAGAAFAKVVFTAQALYPDAPAATDLGLLRSRLSLGPIATTPVRTVNSTIGGNQIAWYTFTTEQACNDGTGCWLDINTQFPGVNFFDTELGVYSAGGVLEGLDDDGGEGLRSLLSFGDTDPARPVVPGLNDAPRDGYSGPLAAGLHYLALGRFNTDFYGTGWFANPLSAAGGDAIIEVRTNLFPAFTYLGTVHSGALMTTPVSVATTEIKWYGFDTPADINNVTRYYMDIDTIELGAPVNDSEIGLYTFQGALIAADDDSGGNGNRSQLSFGIGPANRAPIGSSAAGDGRNGNLVAGRYYLATSTYNTSFGGDWGVNSGGPAGTYPLNFRTNFPSLGCGPADLGSAGGLPGADGALDNNDFIVFITYFFAQNPLADVGIAGGLIGHDNVWDNNDFIAFITLFFNGCP